MPPDARHEAPRPAPGSSAPSSDGRDGLSRLLAELARTPDVPLPDEWQRRLAPGEVVGRLEVVREVGRGGFGVVYEARDPELGRHVAFKALRPGRSLDARQVEALRREAEAAARLNHPNIVTIHDFGRCPAGGPYLVMELLRGEPLSQRLVGSPLPVSEAVRIARQVAEALVHAHAAGVVHRDLKPGNVFLCQGGAVKVLDFGLAHLLGADGARGGTPGYMAPEQCRGQPEDGRTDLFGLGALLYRMLTTRLPFPVEDGRSSVLDKDTSPAPVGPEVPPRLARLLGALLAKDPAARPQSAQEVSDELGAVARALDPLAAARRRRWWIAAALGLVLAAGGGAAAGLWIRDLRAHALERLPVAVADFDNTTGDPQLEGLSALLITSLEQSRKVPVLTRSRMRDELRKLGRGDVERIDESLAREVGRATSARALLLASVRRFGEAYAVELRALDPKNDRYLFAVSEQASRKEDVPILIDRISERTRRALRERDDDLRDSRVEMGQAVTRNLDAYQHYFRGVECIERPREEREWIGCSDHFRAAIAADPGFALAHYQLAYVASTVNVSGAAGPNRKLVEGELDAALRGEAQLPARERSLALALQANEAGDEAAALRRYDEVVRRYPDDKHALYLAGGLLYGHSEYAAAIPYLQKAVDLDPFFENAVRSLVHALGKLRRDDELRALLERWSRLPQNPALRAAAVRGAVWLGDLDRALAEARKNAEVATDVSPYIDLAVVQFSRAEFVACETTLRRAIREFPQQTRARAYLSSSLAAQGKRHEALRGMDEFYASSQKPEAWGLHLDRARLLFPWNPSALWSEAKQLRASDAEVAGTLAAPVALAGDVEHARELAALTRARTPDHDVAEAVLAWRAGRIGDAMARLKALDAIEPTPEWGLPPSFVLTEIAGAAGEDVAVLDAAQRFRAMWPHLGAYGGWTVPRILYLEARSLWRLGRGPEARAAIDRLLSQEIGADAGDNLVRDLLALKADVESAPRR